MDETLQEKLEARTARVSVIGLGYVGLSLAVELAKAGLTVRGVDLDLERVSLLNRGESYLVDVPADVLKPLVASGRLKGSTTLAELVDDRQRDELRRECEFHALLGHGKLLALSGQR